MNKGIFILLFLFSTSLSISQENEPSLKELISMDFDSLMTMGVQTYSKTSETVNEIPAAIYVITENDISRSGATTLHEVLIQAPGLWVNEMTYSQIKFSSRSELEAYFQGISILLDGVRVTNDVIGGFPFNLFDYPIQNIEKIEIIRGPGGIIYGANSTTGIVNIITKKGHQKTNKILSINAGTRDFINPFVSYSFQKNKHQISVFGEFKSRKAYKIHDYYLSDSTRTSDITPYTSQNVDDYRSIGLGLSHKLDISKKFKNEFQLYWNDIYTLAASTSTNNTIEVNNNGGESSNIINKTSYSKSDSNTFFLRTHFNRQKNNTALRGTYKYNITSLNFDLQDNLRFKKHNIIYGLNFNYINFKLQAPSNKSDVNFERHHFHESLYAAYIQDNYKVNDWAHITLGGKLETWTLTSNTPNFLPTIRLLFLPKRKNSFWTSYTKTFTTPGLVQKEIELRVKQLSDELPLPDNYYAALIPGDKIDPTITHNFEIGYRSQSIPKSTLEIALYYNKINGYINTSSTDIKDTDNWVPSKVEDNVIIAPVYYYTNILNSNDFGGEIILETKLSKSFMVENSLSYYKRNATPLDDPEKPGEKYTISPEQKMPNYIYRIRPYLDFPSIGIRTSLWGIYYSNRSFSESLSKFNDQNHIKLNVTVDKFLFNEKLIITLWGKDITNNTPYIEDHSSFLPLEYNHAIHSMYGVRISYNY